MPKGRPWSVDEERQLRKLREEGKTINEIAMRMKKSPDAIKKKLGRLGLKVVTVKNSQGTTSELIVPKDLISVEEALLKFITAMNALEKPGLNKTEVMRLKALVQSSNLYGKRIAEYIDFRCLERELFELKEKYAELVKKVAGKREVN